MDIPKNFDISPIGYVRSTLKERSGAPRQGWEGAPNARLEIHPAFVQGLDGIKSGQVRQNRTSRFESLKIAARSSSRHTVGMSSTDFTTGSFIGSTIV